MKIFNLTPDEEEKFFEHLPRFLLYYLFLFVIFWYGLSVKSAEEIRRDVLSGNVSVSGATFLYALFVGLLVAYLVEKGYISKESSKVAAFMVIGMIIMFLIVMYVGRASVLFVAALALIYVNTLIKVKEESKRRGDEK